MKKRNLYVVIGVTSVVAVVLLLFILFAMNTNLLLIKSAYEGYELGYDDVIISNTALLSSDMKDIEEPVLESELLTSNSYKVDQKTHKVTDEDSDLLYNGRYLVEAKLQNQNDMITLSVTDTVSPKFVSCQSTLYVQTGTSAENLPKYFKAEDKDIKLEKGIFAGKYDPKKSGSYVIQVLAWDSSGNYSEMKQRVDVCTAREIKAKKIVLSEPVDDKEGIVFESEKDFENKKSELGALQTKLREEEKSIIKQLLGDKAEEYLQKETERRKKFNSTWGAHEVIEEGIREDESKDTKKKKKDAIEEDEDKDKDKDRDAKDNKSVASNNKSKKAMGATNNGTGAVADSTSSNNNPKNNLIQPVVEGYDYVFYSIEDAEAEAHRQTKQQFDEYKNAPHVVYQIRYFQQVGTVKKDGHIWIYGSMMYKEAVTDIQTAVDLNCGEYSYLPTSYVKQKPTDYAPTGFYYCDDIECVRVGATGDNMDLSRLLDMQILEDCVPSWDKFLAEYGHGETRETLRVVVI